MKDIKAESTFEDFKAIIDENASHYILLSEEDRKQLFSDFKTEYLKVKNCLLLIKF